MRAILIESEGAAPRLLEDADESLLTGDVALDVLASGLNYKDGMALAGTGIARTHPLIPGIDLVGRVTDSAGSTGAAAERFSAGDLVVLNGDGIGESHHGGSATRARVRADALVRLPATLSPSEPPRSAPQGSPRCSRCWPWRMPASHRRTAMSWSPGPPAVRARSPSPCWRAGASACSPRPAASRRAASTCGSWAPPRCWTAESSPRSRAVRCRSSASRRRSTGWAAPRSPMCSPRPPGAARSPPTAWPGPGPLHHGHPLILRGVTLAGMNSGTCPLPLRERAWDALASELDPELLDGMTTSIGLSELIDHAPRILAGQIRGRTLVEVTQ